MKYLTLVLLILLYSCSKNSQSKYENFIIDNVIPEKGLLDIKFPYAGSNVFDITILEEIMKESDAIIKKTSKVSVKSNESVKTIEKNTYHINSKYKDIVVETKNMKLLKMYNISDLKIMDIKKDVTKNNDFTTICFKYKLNAVKTLNLDSIFEFNLDKTFVNDSVYVITENGIIKKFI